MLPPLLRCLPSSPSLLTCLAFHTSMTGMPAITLLGSSSAAELTVSLAPITWWRCAQQDTQHSTHAHTTRVNARCPLSTATRASPALPPSSKHQTHHDDVVVADVSVDLVHLVHDIVRHARLGQQHVELTWHAPRHGVNAKLDLVVGCLVVWCAQRRVWRGGGVASCHARGAPSRPPLECCWTRAPLS